MRHTLVSVVGLVLSATSLVAQRPLSRADAIAAAFTRGARIAVARADTAVAGAAILAARARPNPLLTGGYSKSVPNYHMNVDIPIDFPVLRALRMRSAETGQRAAQLRFQFERAMIAMEADTAYTRAVAARQRLVLSRRNASDADSLLRMVERRCDAGDASAMDVELARVNAGQLANTAVGDSLTMISAILDLQSVIGIADAQLSVRPTDSLTATPAADPPAGTTLLEASAAAMRDAAVVNVGLQRRAMWPQLSVSFGLEHGDPDVHGALPTVGVGIGLPLFDRNRGGIAMAEAERARAQAELERTGVEMRNAYAHALRERENALRKVARDQELMASGDRIAAMAITAYREGVSSLPNVLTAQQSARGVMAQYIDDLAAAWIATAELRVFSLSPTRVGQ